MKRFARFLAQRTNGELVLVAGISTAVLAGLVHGAPNLDYAEFIVIAAAVALVFGPRLLVRGGRRA